MDSEARQAAKDLRKMLDERTDHGKPLVVYCDDLCDALFGREYSMETNPRADHADVRWLIGILERA